MIPDIRKRVECELVATPLTQKRFVKKTEGTYGPGVDMTRFNVYGAELPPGPATGVTNLWATGDSTYPGIGGTGGGGIRVLHRKLNRISVQAPGYGVRRRVPKDWQKRLISLNFVVCITKVLHVYVHRLSYV